MKATTWRLTVSASRPNERSPMIGLWVAVDVAHRREVEVDAERRELAADRQRGAARERGLVDTAERPHRREEGHVFAEPGDAAALPGRSR